MRFLVLFVFFIFIQSCSKNCNSSNSTCSEMPPTDELCTAFFKRWFYNKSKNACEEISYSGCSAKGFETKVACDSCKCK